MTLRSVTDADAERLAAAIAAHPAGKARHLIPQRDAALFEVQADEYRELARTFTPGSRMADYYRALANGYDDLANTAHTHADLIEQWT